MILRGLLLALLLHNIGISAQFLDSAFIFKKTNILDLPLEVAYPENWKASDKRPVIIFFHSGGYNQSGLGQFHRQALYFASRGVVTAIFVYRVGNDDPSIRPHHSIEDGKSAVRWVRKNANRLGIDTARVVLAGGSAGGHNAMSAALNPYFDNPSEDLTISSSGHAIVGFNPAYLRKNDLQDRYKNDPLSDSEKKELVGNINPESHLKRSSPPSIFFYGTEDPYLLGGYQYTDSATAIGAQHEMYLAEGPAHGFFNDDPWYNRTVWMTDTFLVNNGFLEGEPTITLPDGETLMTKWISKVEPPVAITRRPELRPRSWVEKSRLSFSKRNNPRALLYFLNGVKRFVNRNEFKGVYIEEVRP